MMKQTSDMLGRLEEISITGKPIGDNDLWYYLQALEVAAYRPACPSTSGFEQLCKNRQGGLLVEDNEPVIPFAPDFNPFFINVDDCAFDPCSQQVRNERP